MCNNCEESYHFYCINSSPPPPLLLFRRQSRKYAKKVIKLFHCFLQPLPHTHVPPIPALVICGSRQTKIPTAPEKFQVTASLDKTASQQGLQSFEIFKAFRRIPMILTRTAEPSSRIDNFRIFSDLLEILLNNQQI